MKAKNIKELFHKFDRDRTVHEIELGGMIRYEEALVSLIKDRIKELEEKVQFIKKAGSDELLPNVIICEEAAKIQELKRLLGEDG